MIWFGERGRYAMPIERQVEGVKCRKFGIKEIVGLSIEIDLFEIVASLGELKAFPQ